MKGEWIDINSFSNSYFIVSAPGKPNSAVIEFPIYLLGRDEWRKNCTKNTLYVKTSVHGKTCVTRVSQYCTFLKKYSTYGARVSLIFLISREKP